MRSLPIAWLRVVDVKDRASEMARVWHLFGVQSPLIASVSCWAGAALDRHAGMTIHQACMDALVYQENAE